MTEEINKNANEKKPKRAYYSRNRKSSGSTRGKKENALQLNVDNVNKVIDTLEVEKGEVKENKRNYTSKRTNNYAKKPVAKRTTKRIESDVSDIKLHNEVKVSPSEMKAVVEDKSKRVRNTTRLKRERLLKRIENK